MTTDTAAKRDTQKLQRAIVDGLEDVKAQDIQVFDTEHLSPLFERVIVASGTSNRQTKALAASVVDAVREAGFAKPRVEGQENGEWIIVDCAQAVVHIMQPAFRTYYHLEELWGEKPVRLKFGAARPAAPAGTPAKAPTKTTARGSRASMQAYAGKAPARKAAADAPLAKAPPAKAPTAKAPTRKVATKASSGTASTAGKKATTPAKKAAVKTVVIARTAPATRKPAARKTPSKPRG